MFVVVFFKQKTAYDVRISDWSSDVGSSDLVYARRLQIQERMTNEIADTLDRVLHPRGVAVVIQASHECISSRGIGMHGVAMVTRRLTGQFERDPWRRDILAALAA